MQAKDKTFRQSKLYMNHCNIQSKLTEGDPLIHKSIK